MTRKAATTESRFGKTGNMMVRFVIASYFMAAALGIVPGIDLSVLTSAALPAPFDAYVGSAIVFGLGLMVLTGVALRAAVLVLALLLFWSSYVTMIQMGMSEHLGFFWRDLALVAALLMTNTDTSQNRSLFRHIHEVRKIRAERPESVQPRRIKSELATQRRKAPLIPLDGHLPEPLAKSRAAS